MLRVAPLSGWAAVCVKPVQAIERHDARPIRQLSDQELLGIIQRGSPEPLDEPCYPMIAGPK
jgi:hypothetical protein